MFAEADGLQGRTWGLPRTDSYLLAASRVGKEHTHAQRAGPILPRRLSHVKQGPAPSAPSEIPPSPEKSTPQVLVWVPLSRFGAVTFKEGTRGH